MITYKNTTERLLQNKERKIQRKVEFLNVKEFLNLLENDKIYIPVDEYQRPFKFDQKQYEGIITVFIRNMMTQPISLIVHEKQIKWFEEQLKDATDESKQTKLQKELNDYNNLYCNGKGYRKSVV